MDPQVWERISPPQLYGAHCLLARGEPQHLPGVAVERYLATEGNAPFRRLVLLHRLPAKLSTELRASFVDQVKVLLRLEHNNVLGLTGAAEQDSQLYAVSPAVSGRTLEDLMAPSGGGPALEPALAVFLIRELLRGVHAAHSFPGWSMVHGGLSPKRVHLDWHGGVRVTGFPLVTTTRIQEGTMPGGVYGDSKYLSPEQLRGARVHVRCDVFACGVMLWELLSQRCFRSVLSELSGPNALGRCPAPSHFSPNLDPQLDAVVMRALAVDAGQRWPDAHSMMQRLSEWKEERAPFLGQEGVSALLHRRFSGGAQKEFLARESLLRIALEPPTQSSTAKPQAPVSGAADEPFRHTHSGGIVPAPQSTTPVTLRKDLAAKVQRRRPLVAPPEKLERNSIVAERYQIERRLGRGGMGTVYRAKHLQVGRRVALKVLARAWSHNEDVARRFRAEARAASAAGHPNIVEVFDAGELSDGRLFFVMEYLEGENLYHKLRNEGQMDLRQAIEIMLQVARAVKAAHDVNVIHRDLKPDNVMIVDRGSGESKAVKVLDFGISAMIDERNETRWTKPGHAVGTPEYMAPEQARGVGATNLFDVYAWGAMFFEILCGRAPLTGSDFVDVMAKKNDEPAPSLKSVRFDASDRLCGIIDDCLRIDPAQRPQSMAEILVRLDACALELAQEDEPFVELPVEPAAPLPKPPRRKSMVWTSAFVSACLLTVVAGLWWMDQNGNLITSRPVLKVESTLVASQGAVGRVIDDVGSSDLAPAATAEAAPPRSASLVPRAKSQRLGAPTQFEPDLEPLPLAKTIRSPQCANLEQRIVKARLEGESDLMLGLLRSGRDYNCWKKAKNRQQWARWRVYALKEEMRWSDCMKAALPFSADPQIGQDLALCRARQAMREKTR